MNNMMQDDLDAAKQVN